MWYDQCLEVDGCSSVDGLEGQHHRLESDAGSNRKPVDVMEEGWSHGRTWEDCKHTRCSFLDTLQWFSCRGWESSQEGVAVVQAEDDQCLDQELCCIFCEERPDPADVVDGKSAGSGHSSDVGGQGQSVVDGSHPGSSSFLRKTISLHP